MVEFDSNSNDHLSCLLFGGKLTEELTILDTDSNGFPKTFKTGQRKGQIRTKKIEIEVKIKGLNLKPLADWKTKKEGIFQTNEQILNLIAQKQETDASKISELLLKIRGLRKELSTYYNEDYIYPDSTAHCNYKHAQTETGRLSSSEPNLQNIPGK